VNYPISIGHSFFWYLKSEIFNQDFQHRFGLYLEIFLNKIGKQFSKIFIDEDFLLRKLICAAKIVQNKEISKEIQMKKFKETLEILNQKLKEKKQSISLPLDFKYRVKQIKVEKCKVMKSKKKPLWLVFKNSDPNGDDIIVMFKKGDDLRMDMVTLQIFKEMQNLWYNNGLFLKMSLYKVICTGNNEGMLEMVTDSDTLANIHKQEGGAINTFFSKVSLSNWIKKNCKLISVEEYTNNFLVSCVAYCVATFVLGIGDRHNDNIMIKKNGEIFHIDFGHFLGHVKYKMGIKREWAPFVFTSQFQNVLGGEGGKNYILFKKLLWEAFNVLRKNCENLITLLRILLITGIPELNEKTIKFLGKSLDLKEHDDEEAKKFLNKKLNDSLYSVSTKVNFAIHIVAN
jgi:phosphatidylinositol-4,5-bisphosphate 3-kinase